MNYKPKTIKKVFIAIAVLALIWFLRVDTVLVGENFGWTAFFILLGLALMFNSIEEKEEEITLLRYEMHNLAYGSMEEKEEARSYANEKLLLLEQAKEELAKKYGSTVEHKK
ncbi:MAG: hypothetical protein HYU81_02445 [Candidatus Brennerbacteria bacterium]|nr:hypothetical protein [Candidatus Brennerbacteria bacterium]